MTVPTAARLFDAAAKNKRTNGPRGKRVVPLAIGAARADSRSIAHKKRCLGWAGPPTALRRAGYSHAERCGGTRRLL